MKKVVLVHILLAIATGGCIQSSSEEQQRLSEIKPPKANSTIISAALPSYTWATAKTGPGYMPRLVAMMTWYATQAENMRQMDFIESKSGPAPESADGPPTEPSGPYEVVFETVDDYLATLRKSGYFSAQYLATLHARAQTQDKSVSPQRNFEKYS